MRTEQIHYFLETVKAGSFTKAAVCLHLQQPSLREAITNLENELGQPLFVRTKKGVALTEFGSHCLPYLKNMHDTYLQLRSNNLPYLEQEQYVIASQNAFDFCLPMLYNLLSREFVNSTFKINYIDDSDQIINSVARGLSDVGLLFNICDHLAENAFYQSQLNKSFEIYSFYESELNLVVSPNHPLAAKDTISLTDLYHQTLVFTNIAAPTLEFLQKHIDLNRCEIMNVFNYRLAESYCLDQNCITFLPTEFHTNPSLLAKPFNNNIPVRFEFIYRKEHMNSQTLTCLKYLKSIYSQITQL